MELLLNAMGIEINLVDRYGNTPLHIAASVSYTQIERIEHICRYNPSIVSHKYFSKRRKNTQISELLLNARGIEIN